MDADHAELFRLLCGLDNAHLTAYMAALENIGLAPLMLEMHRELQSRRRLFCDMPREVMA